MTILTIGKRLVTIEHIAFIEAFDAYSIPKFKPEKDFKARVVLLNRDTVLSEMLPEEFAEKHGFRFLAEDSAAVNPRIFFWVESFAATESFQPKRPYQSRLKWRDPDGGDDRWERGAR